MFCMFSDVFSCISIDFVFIFLVFPKRARYFGYMSIELLREVALFTDCTALTSLLVRCS